MAEPILTVEHLVKGYGENTVLDDISFSVRPGEVVVVVGPSGCGKSTLLRCINALEPTRSGRVRLGNETVAYGGKGLTSLRQRIGMVFQSYELFPHLTVLDNVMLAPLKVAKRPKDEVQKEAEALLDRVNLLNKARSYPRELSGGQKQRVAIVRALAMHPEILLFDEVTAALDPEMVREVLDEIKADGTINIGVFSDKNPFGYVDENGEYQGYDIYFANRLAEDLGVKVNYVSTEAANRIEYLQTGKVDVILANFTVTPERAEEVDFALPYMNVALGVVSPDSNVITSLDSWNADDQMIVISGTTAETYLTQNYPDISLQKYDSYATAKSAMENGGVAWANDNTEVIAFASQNPGYTVGIPSLGSQDTIAPAVSKGNETLLNAINDEIKALGKENFFHADYEATLVDTYGTDYEDSLVVEGGETSAQ